MVSATNDARFDVIALITEKFLPTQQEFLISNEIPGVDQLTPSERVEWLNAAIRPRLWGSISIQTLQRLYDIAEGELPLNVAQAIFGSSVLKRAILVGGLGVDHFEMLAVLCPKEMRSEVMAMFQHISAAASATLFLEILNALEK
jgi:hypothetical protein